MIQMEYLANSLTPKAPARDLGLFFILASAYASGRSDKFLANPQWAMRIDWIVWRGTVEVNHDGVAGGQAQLAENHILGDAHHNMTHTGHIVGV